MQGSLKRCIPVLLSALLACALPAGAQDAPDGGTRGLILFPFAYYTPETKAALAVVGVYHFRRPGAGDQPSSLQAFLTYSARSQRSLRVFPEIYLSGGRWLLSGRAVLKDWPDTYYGIGPETPESAEEDYGGKSWELGFEAARAVWSNLRVGLHGEFEESSITPARGGALASGVVAGSKGGKVAGLGAAVSWDSRDHVFFPSRGAFAEISYTRFLEGLGSDFDFECSEADLRSYRPVGAGSVLALRAYARSARGDVPFEHLSLLGGQRLMRGYYRGRFRDRDLAAAEAEFRFPVWKRLGGSVFASAGAVGRDLEEMDSPKAAGGFGLRYRVSRSEPINLRFDAAFTEEGPAFYFTLFEAF